MSLSKSKCWYSNNCLHSLKCAVLLGQISISHLMSARKRFCYICCFFSTRNGCKNFDGKVLPTNDIFTDDYVARKITFIFTTSSKCVGCQWPIIRKPISRTFHIIYLLNGIAHFKNVNNYLNTNIFSYLETSGSRSSNLYLNVVHFFNTSVDKTSVAA